MRILALLSFDIFSCSIGKALESLGHEVCYLGSFELDQLDQTIEEFQPDLAFSMGWDIWHVNYSNEGRIPAVKEILHKHNLFHVYFAEEDWLHHDAWSRIYVSEIQPNFVLTRSAACIERYEQMGVPAAFFDVGCNPEFHKPVPFEPAYACDVAVTANPHFGFGEIREKSISDLVLPLFDQPFHTKIWGRGWDQLQHYFAGVSAPAHMLQGSLPFTETPKVYNSAKISISVQTCNDQLSNRTFDILASGGFLLTSDTPCVREKLTPGVHCVVSSSPQETIELIQYYLAHPDERAEIANAGRKYAIEHFAYQKTLTTIWPTILQYYTAFRKNPVENRPKITLELEKMSFDDWSSYNALNTRPGYLLAGGEVNSFVQKIIPVQTNELGTLAVTAARQQIGNHPELNTIVQYLNSDYLFISYGLAATVPIKSPSRQTITYSLAKVPENARYALVILNKLPQPSSAPIVLQKVEIQRQQ
ncbi:glycosyltransferase family protein [Brevibacillus fulvus]|uniref:Spore maturation protein CgeB n=1 Tax=Brevibacillus fulvus TaxID=1125967 RepID=A0A939BU31_9BACL|nr:glycosyltransferase [Brevibacillus fulvus]MBM7589081.1 spore maturation protein CgeB [Brevibacillus fulvus]